MAETRRARVQREAKRLREERVDLSGWVVARPGECLTCDAVRLITEERTPGLRAYREAKAAR